MVEFYDESVFDPIYQAFWNDNRDNGLCHKHNLWTCEKKWDDRREKKQIAVVKRDEERCLFRCSLTQYKSSSQSSAEKFCSVTMKINTQIWNRSTISKKTEYKKQQRGTRRTYVERERASRTEKEEEDGGVRKRRYRVERGEEEETYHYTIFETNFLSRIFWKPIPWVPQIDWISAASATRYCGYL